MKGSVAALIVVILLVGAAIIGYMAGSSLRNSTDESSVSGIVVEAPRWEEGKYWIYTFNTPQTGLLTSRVAVAGNDGENYNVGVESRMDARRHAVLNFNPMLGRIRMDNLEVYEKGEPKELFRFPLKIRSNWSFSLFDVEDFEARVTSIQSVSISGNNKSYMVNVQAESASTGKTLIYSYDTDAEWIGSLTLKDGQQVILDMKLVGSGSGFSGELYFVRGRDLFSKEYTSSRGSPSLDVYDTFLDQGHPSWGPFDELIYYFEVETGSATAGALTLRDHGSNTHLRRTFEPNTAERALGVLPSEQGEWGVTVTFFGDSELVLKVAGGLEYSWTV